MAFENRSSRRKVPKVIESCVEFLIEHGLEVEGIFRLPGRNALVKQLKECYDRGEKPDFILPDVDVHTVASLLKLYLRELPEPLIPFRFYEAVMKIVNRDMHENPDLAIERLSKLLVNIPQHSYNMIQYLSQFLCQVSRHSHINKMPDMNIATCFAQCYIRPECDEAALLMGTANGRTQVTFILINQSSKIFTMEYTNQGGAVKVDDLLDLGSAEEDTKTFNARTSTIGSVTNDLIGLDLTSDGGEIQLPSPLAPAATPEEKDAVQVETEKEFQNGANPEQDDTFDSSVTSDSSSQDSLRLSGGESNIPNRVAPPPPQQTMSLPANTSPPNDDNPQLYMVPPPPKKRPSLDAPPIPRRPGLEAQHSDGPAPLRLAPRPPSKKSLSSGESLNSSIEGDERVDEEDREIEHLLCTDVASLSPEENLRYIAQLRNKIIAQREQYKDCRDKLQDAKTRHRKQLQDMARKIDHERGATAGAVEKIMAIQSELQQYQMKYGLLNPPVTHVIK